MVSVFECIMLVCFGLSWPISVYKSITSKSTSGKSVVFIVAILIGYVAGITGKLLSGSITYVLAVYIFNFCAVSLDLAVYFFNRRRERLCTLQAQ